MNETMKFLCALRKRLNFHAFMIATVSAFLTASVFAALISSVFIARGEKVNILFLLAPACLFLVLTACVFFYKRFGLHDAAEFADKFFGLKDAMVSIIEFKDSPSSPFHKLLENKTAKECAALSNEKLGLAFPVKRFLVALVFLFLSAGLCALPESHGVLKARLMEEDAKARSEEANKKLKEELEELKKELSDDEKKLLERSDLQKNMLKLKKTGNKKEALKQYANLEKLLREMTEKSKINFNENLLRKLAEELKKNKSAKSLGNELQRKKYLEASQRMEEMSAKLNKAAKNGDKCKLEKMMERLKKLSESIKKALQKQKNESSELSRSMEKLSKSCGAAESCKCDSQKNMEQLTKDMKFIEADMKRLAQALKTHNMKKGFFAKMEKMKASFLSAQNFMADGMKGNKGNKKGIGRSPDDSPNSSLNPTKNRGRLSFLSGKKGDGLSESRTEEAASGTGESGLSAKNAKTRDFKRQMETFVERDDIPDSMKRGVKKYFSIIHKETK